MSCSERGFGTVQVLSRSVAFVLRQSMTWGANDICLQRTERRSNALHSSSSDKENAQEPVAGKGNKRTGDSRAPLAAR